MIKAATTDSTRPVRVGVIGLGWGARVHAPAIQAAKGYQLTALCARDSIKRQAIARKFGVEDGGSDWRAFVRRKDLDLISIATPPNLHAEMAYAAIQAGKHIYVEKPSAPTEAAALQIAEAAERAGVQGATGFEFRWQSDRSVIAKLVREQLIGRPLSFRLVQSWGWNHPHVAMPLGKESADNRLRFDNGGGFLQGMLSHDIDYMRALFGNPVAVAADRHVSFPEMLLNDGTTFVSDADDVTTLLFRFRSGMAGLLSASVVGIHQHEYRIEIYGSDATIVGHSDNGVDFDIRAGRPTDMALSTVPLSPREPASGPIPQTDRLWTKVQAHALLLEDWRPAFDGHPPLSPIPSLRDGWQVQRIIAAARKSSDGAGWVSLE